MSRIRAWPLVAASAQEHEQVVLPAPLAQEAENLTLVHREVRCPPPLCR